MVQETKTKIFSWHKWASPCWRKQLCADFPSCGASPSAAGSSEEAGIRLPTWFQGRYSCRLMLANHSWSDSRTSIQYAFKPILRELSCPKDFSKDVFSISFQSREARISLSSKSFTGSFTLILVPKAVIPFLFLKWFYSLSDPQNYIPQAFHPHRVTVFAHSSQ